MTAVLEANVPSTLTADELERAARFLQKEDADRFAVARIALRELLGEYSGLAAGMIALGAGKHGKPYLANPTRQCVEFNLTHAGNVVLIAISSHGPVGVDVELICPRVPGDRLAERFFAPGEVAALRSLPEHLRRDAFFACWTRKESLIKALGLGLSFPLAAFEVGVASRGPVRLTGPIGMTDMWRISNLEVPHGYAAAVASRPGACIRQQQWTPRAVTAISGSIAGRSR